MRVQRGITTQMW